MKEYPCESCGQVLIKHHPAGTLINANLRTENGPDGVFIHVHCTCGHESVLLYREVFPLSFSTEVKREPDSGQGTADF